MWLARTNFLFMFRLSSPTACRADSQGHKRNANRKLVHETHIISFKYAHQTDNFLADSLTFWFRCGIDPFHNFQTLKMFHSVHPAQEMELDHSSLFPLLGWSIQSRMADHITTDWLRWWSTLQRVNDARFPILNRPTGIVMAWRISCSLQWSNLSGKLLERCLQMIFKFTLQVYAPQDFFTLQLHATL